MRLPTAYATYCSIRAELAAIIQKACPDLPLNKALISAIEGSIKVADAWALAQILETYKPSTILEVGSFLGFSTRWLLEVGKSWGCRVTAVDPNVRHRIYDSPRRILEQLNARFLGRELEVVTAFVGPPFPEKDLNWRYKAESAANPDFMDDLLQSIPVVGADWGRSFEAAFIDGQHHYDAVMRNYAVCAALVEDSGVLTFHDPVTWPEVAQALSDIEAANAGRRMEILNASQVFSHPCLTREGIRTVDGIGVLYPAVRNPKAA